MAYLIDVIKAVFCIKRGNFITSKRVRRVYGRFLSFLSFVCYHRAWRGPTKKIAPETEPRLTANYTLGGSSYHNLKFYRAQQK